MSKFPELEKYFEKEYNKLVQKVSRRAGSPENAEDVVQESFFRACKYWASYNPERQKLGAWFNTILSNACKDKVRDERMLGMSVELEESHIDPVEMEEEVYAQQKVMALWEDKNDVHKEVLRLYYECGYKPVEIKEVLDLELGTTKQIIWRFKQEVKEKLGE